MDVNSINSPFIADKDSLFDFIESLKDTIADIERDVGILNKSPQSPQVIDNLFRAIHNIKGDASLCKVEIAATLVHPVETALARVRKKEVTFTPIFGEAILLMIDRLELAMSDLLTGKSLASLHLPQLMEGFDKLAVSPIEEIDLHASNMIEIVTGFRPASESSSLLEKSIVNGVGALGKPKNPTSEDLIFFRSLAHQFEIRSPDFEGRTARLLRLASETSKIRPGVVDAEQLEAAVYMHDIGMMFLPESLWLTQDRISDEQRKILRTHPALAAGILSRMHGWEDAAKMVAQHHEMAGGEGYPNALPLSQICDGAKILSIVDAFESIMLKHSSRGRNRSVLRAVAEINACDDQFAPEWIGAFNQVVRSLIEAG